MNKKVSKFIILTSDNINGQTGAAKFCRYIVGASEYWASNNISTCEYSNSGSFTNAEVYAKSKTHLLKQYIKRSLNKSSIGKRISFYRYKVNFLGKHPVDAIPEEILPNSCVLINDIFAAINFYKKYQSKYNTIFMMHNGGDLLSMMTNEMADANIAAYLTKAEKIVFDNATKIVFVSAYAKQKFDTAHPYYKNKTFFVYNGMKEIKYDLKERKYDHLRMVTVGSVSVRKNQIEIIKALDKLQDKSIELTVVGNGESFEQCKQYVLDHNLQEQVHLVGAQNDVTPFLRGANLFIMTSKDEGLPIAAQEAANAGLPIIITDVGGCRDLISDNGRLVKLNQNEIIDAISFYNNHKDVLKTDGEKSYELFKKNFTIISMLDGYRDLLNIISPE